MNNTSKSLIDRFWEHVEITDDCWIWNGASSRNGYGELSNYSDGKHSQVATHRLSWELHNGSIPVGMCVLHKCDNPPCVNPSHLYLGTKKDNSRDCIQRGRFKRNPQYGVKNKSTKLKMCQVIQIRELLAQGLSQRKVARIFNVGQYAIASISREETWKCVGVFFELKSKYLKEE
jgi:hypothetical protein